MKKILVAEDDKFLIKIYDSKLRKEGYEIILAYNGTEAIEHLKDMPDIVILDLVMPQKDGFEVLEEIKSNPKTKKIPVIVLSNLCQEKDVQKCKSLGADEFLIKSNTPINDIASIVKKLIGD